LDCLQNAGTIGAIARAHDGDGARCGQHRTVAGAGVVAMAVGDDGLVDRPRRIDMEAAGLAVESGRRRLQPGLGMGAVHLPEFYSGTARYRARWETVDGRAWFAAAGNFRPLVRRQGLAAACAPARYGARRRRWEVRPADRPHRRG